MDCNDIQAATKAICGRVACTDLSTEGPLLVSLPLTYHDGDHPQAIIHSRDGYTLIEDFGSAVGRLASLGVDTEGVLGQAEDVAYANGLAFSQGALILELRPDARVDEHLERFIVALLQIDALGWAAQEHTRTFSVEVTDWLQSHPDYFIEPRSLVGIEGRTYRVTARAYRSVAEREKQSATIVQAVGNRRGLEHGYYLFTDLAIPWYEKVAVVRPQTLEKHPTDAQRLRDHAAVANWGTRDILSRWLAADNDTRQELGRYLGVESPML